MSPGLAAGSTFCKPLKPAMTCVNATSTFFRFGARTGSVSSETFLWRPREVPPLPVM